ncbi:MAG: 23S rRNA (adenine(2030)-N(6))-methyltransferase RlmJ [Opitutaceae bacterium]
MNYRHQFHAGNFADVLKHVLLVELVRALQRKEKGFVFLDTHAGRGRYDLAAAASGDSQARRPEWPEGVGRLWNATGLPETLVSYLALARAHDESRGNLAGAPRFYPGSPLLVAAMARPVDRLVLCELNAAECDALRGVMAPARRCEVRCADGYAELSAVLPPLERRALVLIDPPYEAQDEFARAFAAMKEGLRRLAGGVFALWYPLTGRARADDIVAALREFAPAPVLAVELNVAAVGAGPRLSGCGLAVVNPPWRFDAAAGEAAAALAALLGQGPGSGGRVEWVVPPT